MRFFIPLNKRIGVRVKLFNFTLTPILSILISFFAIGVRAETYLGGGIGSSEFCETKNKTLYESDCRSGGLLLHANLGSELSNWFVAEGSVDALISSLLPRRVTGSKEDRISVLTVGLHGFFRLPVTDEFKFFTGPSVGTSMSRVAIKTPDWQNQNKYNGDVNTEFDAHYGWAVGFDLGNLNRQIIRVQWQEWRSVNSGAGGELNAHYLSLNFIRLYN